MGWWGYRRNTVGHELIHCWSSVMATWVFHYNYTLYFYMYLEVSLITSFFNKKIIIKKRAHFRFIFPFSFGQGLLSSRWVHCCRFQWSRKDGWQAFSRSCLSAGLLGRVSLCSVHHSGAWFVLWLLCLQCLVCQPNDGHSCLHTSNTVSPSMMRRRQDVFLIETFTSDPVRHSPLIGIVCFSLSHFWVEDTHPPVADTPYPPPYTKLSLVSKALLSVYCVFRSEPDATGNKLEIVRHGFCPSEPYVLIREKSKNMRVHYEMLKAFVLMHPPLFLNSGLWIIRLFSVTFPLS